MSNMTVDKLRSLYGDPSPRAAAKVIYAFDQHCHDIIAHSTFLILATTDGDSLDVSPKGDPAGFVKVESSTTLLLPDRPGNNRIDGLVNILANPQVAMLFMIPAVNETLRVNGTAEIIDDAAICDQFKVGSRSPKTVLRITAAEIYTHCGKAPLRAGLWAPETWPSTRPVATLFEMVRDHSQLQLDAVDQEAVDRSYNKSLY